MDIYPIALALYSLLTVFSLISLKSAMREVCYEERMQEDSIIKKMVEKSEEEQSNKNQKSESCRILKYFLDNYTCWLLFRGRMGVQFLSLLFAYSIVGMFLFQTKFWFPSIGFASIVSVTSIILQLLQQKSIKHEKSSKQQPVITRNIMVKKVLFVLMGVTTIAIYLSLIGLCFKNYINSQLSAMLLNFGIVFAIDNLAVKPFLFLSIALIIGDNRVFISIINRQQQKVRVNKVRVANNFGKQPETRHHFVMNLDVEPVPVELNRSKQFNRSRIMQSNVNHAPQALPSSSIIDTIQIHQDASVENMVSRNQSRKSVINKHTSMKDLNEIQLQRIEENPGHELKHYFCINLRRDRQQEQTKQIQTKMESILQEKSNVQTAEIVKQFIFEDFICSSPKNEEINQIAVQQQPKSSKYSKSKGSLRGNKTFRILERENEAEIAEKENMDESTKHEISENEISGLPKDFSHCSSRRTDNKTHILKINGTEKQAGQLEEIDINSPNKRAFHKNSYDTHVIPEETVRSKRKRNRRGTTKQISQPYLLQDKLIEVYFPGRSKPQFDSFVRSKRKNFDRSQFFNYSSKKEGSKSRQKPIVHEIDEQHTEFFVPKF